MDLFLIMQNANKRLKYGREAGEQMVSAFDTQ